MQVARQATAWPPRALGNSGGGAGAARLLGLLYDPEIDHARLLACLNGDPALAARVLKVANTPYYRVSGSVGTVDRALALLGLTAIRGIAAAGCLDRLSPARAGHAYDPESFRRHSLAVACAAQALARLCAPAVAGEAFMAGLLHDIGLLLLVQSDSAAVARFEPPDSSDAAAARAAEEAHFGTTHEACGAQLVQSWGLPAWLVAATAAHHGVAPAAPPAQGLGALPALLALADHAAQEAGCGLWPRSDATAAATLAAHLGLPQTALADIADALPEAVAQLGSVR